MTDASVIPALKYRQELLKDTSVIIYRPSGTSAGQICKTTVGSLTRRQSTAKTKGKLLHRLVSHFQPDTIIELGGHLGVGTLFLASARTEAKVYSVEGSEELLAFANQKSTKTSNIERIPGEFQLVLPALLEKTGSPDFVFIDGDHRYEATISNFRLLAKAANNSTVLVFDDIHWSPGMEEAWNEIIQDQMVTLSVDLYHLGLVFFRKELSKQFFCLRF